jgi:hypothetical protein
MTTKEKRESLFNMYAANLTSGDPTIQDMFACPFCHIAFDRTALGEPPQVILAHCIPDSLDGTLVTLACEPCDTESGRTFDKYLKTRLENGDFWAGHSPDPRRGWIFIDGLRIRCDLEIKQNDDGTFTHSVFADEKHGPKADFEALKFGLDNGIINIGSSIPEIALDPRGVEFDWRGAQIAVLRCAYLMMFRFMGYGYILHPNVQAVRQQLLHPDQWILPCLPIINVKDGTQRHGIGIITKPHSIRGFSVLMPFVTDGERQHRMAVLMPGLDHDDGSIFEKVYEAQRAQKRIDIGFSMIPPYPNVLSAPNSAHFPRYVWKKYGPQQA